MASSGRKDNENPEVRAINATKSHLANNNCSSSSSSSSALQWSQLGSFQQLSATTGIYQPYIFTTDLNVDSSNINNSTTDNNDDDDNVDGFSSWIPMTSQDKAIFQNLTDISHLTRKGTKHHHRDSGVYLLESSGGLVIPTTKTKSKTQQRIAAAPIFAFVDDDDNVNDDNNNSSIDSPTMMTVDDNENNNNSKPVVDNDNGITTEEVFDIIRNIQDPEHPHTLEELGVVSLPQVKLINTTTTTTTTSSTSHNNNNNNNISNKSAGVDESILTDATITTVKVRFTPTIPHCSMATLIGLCLRVKLLRSLPSCRQYQISVQIEPGTHASELAINKQLRDKERVCAALENKHLAGVVNKCIRNE